MTIGTDDFFSKISPYAWGLLGIGICIGLSVAGAAWHVFLCIGKYNLIKIGAFLLQEQVF